MSDKDNTMWSHLHVESRKAELTEQWLLGLGGDGFQNVQNSSYKIMKY